MLWTQFVVQRFPGVLRVNGRLVLVGDGIKAPKQGKKMPGVKKLHQGSGNANKPTYFMGHSFQALTLLVQAAERVLAVPLIMRLQEGVIYSNRDRRTLLNKMLALLSLLALSAPAYLVADAYYANRKMITGLREQDHHLITRVRTNAIAWTAYTGKNPSRQGRPRVYGEKVKLVSLFNAPQKMATATSPVYGEKGIILRYRCRDLLWRPAGISVRVVAVIHPVRGRCLLLSTDSALTAADIIYLYGLRFKIEHTFKQAAQVMGCFDYHFWMKSMKPRTRRGGNQYLHHETEHYRAAVKRKWQTYHVFVQACLISQGLLQYLSSTCTKTIWQAFRSWIRTRRAGVPPSEWVTAVAMRNSLPEFLVNKDKTNNLAEFIAQRMEYEKFALFRLAS